MYVQSHHPYLGSELAHEKQRDLIGRATRLNTARPTRAKTRISPCASLANRLLARYLKRHRAAAIAADLVQTPSELETATVTLSR